MVTLLGTWAIASMTAFGVGATQTTLGQEGHSQCHLQLGRQGKWRMSKGEEGRDWIKISRSSRPGFSVPSGS